MTVKHGYSVAQAQWRPVRDVDRSFVKVRNPDPSPAKAWRESAPNGRPTLITVIIPTSDADRRGLFQRLLDQLAEQTLADFELIVIKGDSRQGRAINVAAAMAAGAYLVTLDDDTDLPQPDSFAKLVAVMADHRDIGIAGGNAVIPAGVTPFVRKVMRELPRRAWEPVREILDSDLVQHPLLIMRTAEFKAVGGENELIPRGLDPYLRQEFRNRGLRVALVPGVIYAHLPPDVLPVLVKQFYRNGMQAAFVNRTYPQWVIETPDRHGAFKPRVPLVLRVFRLPLRLAGELLSGKFLRFICESAYMLGFARNWIFGVKKKQSA
jgi:glycosyltransferase involved in cell wall biosynthesis